MQESLFIVLPLFVVDVWSCCLFCFVFLFVFFLGGGEFWGRGFWGGGLGEGGWFFLTVPWLVCSV